MRHAFLYLAVTACVACVGDDNISTHDAASDVTTTPDASVDAPIESSPVVDASDGGDGNVAFCQSPANTSAAFCADFETVLNPGDNWDFVTTVAGTLTLDSTIAAAGSARSALFSMTSASNSHVQLSKTIHPGVLKSKVLIDFDAYFQFPSWNGSTDNDEFMTFILSTGGSGPYFIDIERAVQWQSTNAGSATKTFADVSAGAWHHFSISYNGSTVPVGFNINIDSTVAVNTTLPQFGTPAPTTFDTVDLNADAENSNTSPATLVHYDNIVVRFP